MGLFVSCATGAARLRPSEGPVFFTKPSPAMEQAIQRIKQNPGELKKDIVLDESGGIFVRAELAETVARTRQSTGGTEHFLVIYNLKHSQADGAGGFWVPFTVESAETGAIEQDTLLWAPGKDAAGILLTFDDDYIEAWECNFDLFDRYGAKVTFFVQGEYSAFSNWALERGHDVGYHTIHHLNLPKVSRDVFYTETLSRVESFREAGVPLDSFAYPFGLSEPWMHDELLGTFKFLRGYGVSFRAYNYGDIREGYLYSKAIDTILFKQDEDFMAIIDLMFRAIKFAGGDLVLPLTTHDISDTADWGITPHRLQYLLETAGELKLNFYRYKDFIERDLIER